MLDVCAVDKDGAGFSVIASERGEYATYYVGREGVEKRMVYEPPYPPGPDGARRWPDYETFAGVLGKFNPWQFVWREPVAVEALDYETVFAIHGERGGCTSA